MGKTMKRKIVMITTSPIPYGQNITDGPGYRAWNLMSVLAEKHDIVILSLYESFHLGVRKQTEIEENNIRIKCIRDSPRHVAEQVELENPDIIYLPWSSTPFLSAVKQKIPTILDYVGAGLLEEFAKNGYVPLPLLQLKMKSFWLGDFLLTAGERERYYLLGLLAASKKLSHVGNAKSNPLIDVIPMTPPINPPLLTNNVIEKTTDELVLLVAGAFLPWYDYKTFFEALTLLVKNDYSNFKVLIMGGSSRNPRFEDTVKKFSDSQTIKSKIIFTGLVPFKQRSNYYLSADVAVNIPSITIEDELSVRTRVIDYLWANLPILTPGKDEYSSAVIDIGGGFSYKAGDPFSLSRSIASLMKDRSQLENAKKNMTVLLSTKFNINNYLSNLERFIEDPFVDPMRDYSLGKHSDVFLWIRDIYNMLKR
jgi:glycosyltransferase involved in cell wall biosynthesis